MNNIFRSKSFAIFITIVVLAILLRFYQLGSNPPSLDWDEASLGYNAYSILKTGADEYGNKMPLSIRSFDDYKPPLYVYLTVPFIAIFGLNEFSVRFVSAIIGVLTVIACYFLVKEILDSWDLKKREVIALISTFFLAISPWHLQFSRAAFEGNIGLFFFTCGVLFFLKGLKNRKFFILSSASFVLSLYSYHSFRLVVPIFLFSALILYWKEVLREKLYLSISIIIMLLFAAPVFWSLFSSQGTGSRLSMVTIFGTSDNLKQSVRQLEYDKSKNDYLGLLFHNRRVVYGLDVVKGYFDHWNPDFLFLHGDGGRQHHAVNIGMLYLWDLPFILFGVYFLLKKINKRILILFFWFLIAPVAASITTGTPHPVRAIAMALPFSIFSAVGVVVFVRTILNSSRLAGRQEFSIFNKKAKYTIFSLTFLFFIFNVLYYFHQYYVHTPIEYGDFWQYGNKELFNDLKQVENNYKEIIVTYRYDQPYIYYLFYNKVDPLWYQKNWDSGGTGQIERMVRDIGKYKFRNINWSMDKNIKNALVVGTPDEIPVDVKALKEIKFLDGSIAFKIIKT